MDVKLAELGRWLGARDFTPNGIIASVRRGEEMCCGWNRCNLTEGITPWFWVQCLKHKKCSLGLSVQLIYEIQDIRVNHFGQLTICQVCQCEHVHLRSEVQSTSSSLEDKYSASLVGVTENPPRTVPPSPGSLFERACLQAILFLFFTPPGHERYYNKYINVKKGGFGGVAMLLVGYVALSYMWEYDHISKKYFVSPFIIPLCLTYCQPQTICNIYWSLPEHDRWRKYH